MTYPSCAQCKKKVLDTGKCVMDHTSHVINRYMLQFAASDWTGHTWLGAFDEIGQVIFGVSGDVWVDSVAPDNDRKTMMVMEAGCRPYKMSVKAAKEGRPGEEEKVRYRANRIEKIDFVAETNQMLAQMSI